MLHCILKLICGPGWPRFSVRTPVHVNLMIEEVGAVLLRFINGCVCRRVVKFSSSSA